MGRLKPELRTMRQRTVDSFRGARLSSPRIHELIVEFERAGARSAAQETFTRCSTSQISKDKSGNQDATPDSNTARPRGDRGSVGHLRPGLVRAIGSNHRKSNRPERRSSSGRGDRCHQRSDECTENDRHEWRGDLRPSVPRPRRLRDEGGAGRVQIDRAPGHQAGS